MILILVIAGCAGCELSDQQGHSKSPTNPGHAGHLVNYWSIREPTDGIGVYLPANAQKIMAVNVPAGGPYRLTYTVERSESPLHIGQGLFDYHLVFEAYTDAVLCIGIHDGDLLNAAFIEQGHLDGDPLHTDPNIGLFAWPYEWSGWPEDIPHPTDAPLTTIVNTRVIVANQTVADDITVIENFCRVVSPTPVPAAPVSESTLAACSDLVFAASGDHGDPEDPQLSYSVEAVYQDGSRVNWNSSDGGPVPPAMPPDWSGTCAPPAFPPLTVPWTCNFAIAPPIQNVYAGIQSWCRGGGACTVSLTIAGQIIKQTCSAGEMPVVRVICEGGTLTIDTRECW